MKFIVTFTILFLSLLSWGVDFESYVVDTKVSSESYGRVEEVENFDDYSIGSSFQYTFDSLGIYVQNRGIFDGRMNFSIRGSRFSQVLFSFNGVSISDPQSGHLNTSLPLTVYDIGKVSIQKSGNSAIYGADALGGVVDFGINKKIEENLKLDVFSGDLGLLGISFSVSKGFGIAGLRVSFDRKQSEGWRTNTDFNTWTLSTLLSGELLSGNFSILFGHTERDFGASKFFGTEAREFEIVNLLMGEVDFKFLHINVFWRNGLDRYVVNVFDPNTQTNLHEKNTIGAKVEVKLNFENYGKLALGVETKANFLNSIAIKTNVVTNLLGQRFDLPIGVFGEYSIALLNNLYISPAFRLDIWQIGDRNFGIIPLPSLRSYLYPVETIKVSINLGKSFRVPNYTELYYYDGVSFGSTNLSPEEGWNYEANLDYFIDSERKSLVFVSGYWKDLQNIIDFADDKTVPGNMFVAQNIRWVSGGGVETGLELDTRNIIGTDGKIKLFYGFAKFNSGADPKYTFRYDRYLEHQLNLVILQKLFGFELYLATSLRNRFEGYDVNGVLLPYTTYTLINGKLSYEIIHNGKLFVEGFNIGDVTYDDIKGAIMPRRTLWAGLEFKFM